jgi:peroxiredoxin
MEEDEMSLHEELRALYENGHLRLPVDVRETMSRGADELADSGLAEHALGVGARAPEFALYSASGKLVRLDALLADGPLVLTFYRGAWCPYCNLALRALQQRHDAIRTRGAHLVAVSPQIPDKSLSLVERHELAFEVLTDIGSDTAKQYGIAFDISNELAALYDQLGFDLQHVNAGYARTLPLPATYVIDRTGIIRWAFIDTDYTVRAEPADVLAALDTLP